MGDRAKRFQIRFYWENQRYYFGLAKSAKERDEQIELLIGQIRLDERMGRVVSSNGVITKRRWYSAPDDTWFEVKMTRSTGKTVWDSIETIYNEKKDVTIKVTRRKLKEITDKKHKLWTQTNS